MKKLFLLLFLFCSGALLAQVKVTSKPTLVNNFPVCADGKVSSVYIDSSDYEVVKKVPPSLLETSSESQASRVVS